MKLKTKRLIIEEKLKSKDLKKIFEFFQDTKTIQYFSDAETFKNYKNAKDVKQGIFDALKRGLVFFRIILKTNKDFIGYLIYIPKNNFAIYIGRTYQSKGYGTEVLIKFLDYMFKVRRLNKVSITSAKENKAALKIYVNKLGFKITKIRKNIRKILVKKDGEWATKLSDTVYLELDKKDFKKNQLRKTPV